MDRLIKLELSRLNVHLPEKRMTLREALSSSKPEVMTRNGGKHALNREELEFLAGLLPEKNWNELQLPILIAFEPKFGKSAARISGKAGAYVVSKILDKEEAEELLIYRPEVAILRKKLPTTTQYVFIG
ncbi:MAG TPA: DUF61 family protein [Hadesarchaea archaeon]|nr:DUF61 family protein [Hadesarchaea archaeon]